MKTFKQFAEARVGPSKTPATDAMKIKHDKDREATTAKAQDEKERQSVEFQQIAAIQKGEMERAKKTDKDAIKSKAVAAKREKEQAKKLKKKKKK